MRGSLHHRWFGRLSLALVAVYFVVGLWPFDFQPHNHVSWLADRAGLHFEPYGIAYDPAPLPMSATGRSANFTIELWVEAQHEPANDVFDILTIHNPGLPLGFALGQWKRGFLLREAVPSPQRAGRIPEVSVDDALQEGKAQFITVRGDKAGTDVYLNGKAAGHFPYFALNADELNGQLILGNDASGRRSWTGRLFGLALYDRALDAAEIAGHYTLWTQGHAGQLTNASGLRALYLFNEGHGQKVQDFSGAHHQLIIPAVFGPIHREILIAPWKDHSYHRLDYMDIIINILGFMPFGFCFFVYRHLLKPNRRLTNALLAIIAGVAVSLTIEIIQAWLPNRVSSTMDLTTNTMGTLLGVILAIAAQSKLRPASNFRTDSAPE